MIYIALNAVPILVAALVSVALAFVWYRNPVAKTQLITLFLAQVWLAAILAGALILAPPRGGVWTMTLGSAAVIWIGFVLPVIVGSYRLRDIAWRTVVTDAGYWLVAMLAQAAIMRLIGVVPPPV